MTLHQLLRLAICPAVAFCLYAQQPPGVSETELKDEVARLQSQTPPTPAYADALERLGRFYLDLGRLADAEPLLERVLAVSTQSDGFPVTAQAAASIARGDLYHTLAEREGSVPSWNGLAGLDYWHAVELLNSAPGDPLARAGAMIRWTSTTVLVPPSANDPHVAFVISQLNAALAIVEPAQGSEGPLVQLARSELVLLYQGMKRRDQLDRLCPTTLVESKQIRLLAACSRAVIETGSVSTAESFAKRAEALLAGEPPASLVEDRVRTSLVLAESAQKQGHLDEARRAADQAVALCGQYLGPSHQLRAESLKTQARVFDQLKMKPESKRALKESEDISAANKKQTANQRLTLPRLISRPEPTYSPEAKAAHIEGTLFLLCEIGPGGNVRVLALLNQLGHGLEGQAIAAISRWRFEPMKKDGHAVASSGMIEVTFKLN